MRKILAVKIALACGLCMTNAAHAQMTVDSPIADGLSELGMNKDAVSWALQAQSMTQQIAQLTSILQQAQQLYSMMNNPLALAGAATSLLTGGAQSPLGADVNATLQLASGIGRLVSTASALAQQVEQQNTFFMPAANGSFSINMLIQRANQTSAIQAQIQTLMTQMTNRISGIQTLQTSINAGGDAKTMATYQARMATELAVAQNQGQQLQALIGLANVQKQVEEQQNLQKAALDDNQFLSSRTSAAAGLVSFSPTGVAPALATPSLTASTVGSFPVAAQ